MIARGLVLAVLVFAACGSNSSDQGAMGADAASLSDDATSWATTPEQCGNGAKPSVPAADFCAYYDMKCAFNYGSSNMQYDNKKECLKNYVLNTPEQQACVAYHLCLAGTSSMVAQMQCPQVTGGAGNSCNLTLR
jgi:hypothetical protein